MGSTQAGMLGTGLACACLLAACAPACPLPGRARTTELELFFGGSVAEPAWSGFTAGVLTPAFPAGFTVHAASGQWRDGPDRPIEREASRVLQVFGRVDAATIAGVVAAYRLRFSQQSVGVVTRPACAVF